MSNRPYQLLGVGVPQMYGRRRLTDEIVRRLTKPTPDHVQVVGPEHYGKSVLLHHLSTILTGSSTHSYGVGVYWDLGHLTPASDGEFAQALVGKLRERIASVNPDLASYLDPDGNALGKLQLAFELLEADGHRVLVILDGFDRVLRSTQITRNLWDQLRDLGHKSSLRYVTGSRVPLRELCKTDDAQTSDFWTLFNPAPVMVAALDNEDLEAFCDPLGKRGVTIDQSALKEIVNWTGGVPLLAAAMFDQLYEAVSDGACVDKVQVDAIGKDLLDNRRDLLQELVSDCALDMQNVLVELTRRPLAAAEVPNTISRYLVLRGFVIESGGRLRFASRLIECHVERQSGGLEDLRRQFGNEEHYLGNVRVVLELRLAQVRNADSELKAGVERAVRELPDLAGVLIHMRRVADRALDLIWAKELLDGRSFPNEWMREWNFKNAYCPIDGRIEARRGLQVRSLEVMTGTDRVHRLSRFVTKPTAMLVSHIHSVGDFGQHQEGPIRLSAVIGACWAAVELCHSLTADLNITPYVDRNLGAS